MTETRRCQNCRKDFTIEPEDFDFYKKINVPPPTWCPECRSQRRMLWRNERQLYKTVCGLCGKSIIAMYDPKDGLSILCDNCWWGDKWDPMKYGFSYDFGENFLSQWKKLLDRMPLIQAWKFRNVDCDYVNYATDDKNCYLSSSIVGCEDVSYSYAIDKSQNVLDSEFVNQSTWCYENLDSRNNYNSKFLTDSENCLDSTFLFDCVNCRNCFMSSNLRNKQYVFQNSQYTKVDYEEKIKKISTGSLKNFEPLIAEFEKMKERISVHRFAQIINAPNSSGDHIENSKNISDSFGVYNSENLKRTIRASGVKDSHDVYGTVNTELAYDSVAPSFRGSDALFVVTNFSSRGIRYAMLCSSSSDLFGCIGLKNASYCILNKQYTKESFDKLRTRIIKHMNTMPYVDKSGRVYRYGEFFPPELSPFAYNETIAEEYFPLSKEEALSQGYRWKDPEIKEYKVTKLPKDLPDHIKDVDDGILKETIGCASNSDAQGGRSPDSQTSGCTTAFRIIKEELQLYRKMNLPLPRLCPNCRHYQRLKQRNPLKLWHRRCMKPGCMNEFETPYAPERPEIIYCESCYNAEVV